MLEVILSLAISLVVTWVLLMLAMVIISRIADIGFPPLNDFLWKTAVIVGVTSLVTVLLGLISGLVGVIVGFVVFLGLMVKLLDLDLWQCLIIVVATWILRGLVLFGLVVAIH